MLMDLLCSTTRHTHIYRRIASSSSYDDEKLGGSVGVGGYFDVRDPVTVPN